AGGGWGARGAGAGKRSASRPAPPRPRCWSRTSSTHCEHLARSKSRLSRAARSILSSASPANWRRAETFTRQPQPETATSENRQKDRKNASSVFQRNAYRRLHLQAETLGAQTLSARADAGAAVSLQPCVGRLR